MSTHYLIPPIAPTKLRLALYQVSNKFAWLSIGTEISFFSRFVFSSIASSLQVIPNILGWTLPTWSIQGAAGLLTFFDVLTNVSTVAPKQGSQMFWNLEEKNNQLVAKASSPDLLSPLIGWKKIIDFIFRNIFLTGCIGIQLFMGGATNWLGLLNYPYVEEHPWLNYSLGPLTTLIGANYIMLFLAKNIRRTYTLLRDAQLSLIRILFKLSPFAFSQACTRLLIAILYNSATYGFIAKSVAASIFNLSTASQMSMQFITMLAIMITTFGSRAGVVCRPYLAPYLTSNGQYDLNLLHQQPLTPEMIYLALPLAERTTLMLKSIPLALLRGISLFYLFFPYIRDAFRSDQSNEQIIISTQILLSIFSMLGGLITHAYTTEVKKNMTIVAREKLDRDYPQYALSTPENTPVNQLAWWLAATSNLGLQLARGLISLYGHIVILGPLIGEKTAFSLGLVVVSEMSWVNFQLYQESVAERFSQFQQVCSSIKSNLQIRFFRNSYASLSRESTPGIELSPNPNSYQT